MPQSLRARILALLGVLATLGVTVAVVDNGPDHGPDKPRATVTVRLGKPAQSSPAIPNTITVPAAAVQKVASSDAGHHEGSRDETPAGVPAQEIEAGQEKQDDLARSDQLPVVAPDAAPSQAGCRSRFITSYSSRRGVAPHEIVLHLTVSPNVAGWSDVDGVTGFFSRAATQASSNYVLDGEGHCNYIVREVDKAWAQAAFNPYAISIEVVNTGHEPVYIRAAGLSQLARIVHDAAHRWGIPLQVGAVAGCVPTRYGIVTHQMLGACGGGHVDITPYDDPDHKIIRAVIAAAKQLDPKPVKPTTAVDRTTCRKLNHYRSDRAIGVKVSPHRTAINVARRKALERRHVVCTAKGPVKR